MMISMHAGAALRIPVARTICAALLVLSGSAVAQQAPEISTRKDSVSYAYGMNIGQTFKLQGADIDVDLLAAGMRAALTGAKPAMSDDLAAEIVMAYQQDLMQKRQVERTIAGQKNKQEGERFLAENKTKEGVITLESGLQYKILVKGDGPIPSATDKVKTHYRGTLIDGTEFDSSIKRGQPASFPVSGVIKGWTEALQLMPVGSKWMLYIPSQLAYGDRGAGATIGPQATLIFEIELLEIEK